MNREEITGRQGISLIILWIFGSTLIAGGVNEAEKDSWLTAGIGALYALPVILIYARMLKLAPQGMNIFTTIEWALGKVMGKAVVLLYAWFALHLGALVIRNVTEFVSVATLPETPQYIMALLFGFAAIWAVKSGIETLGRWGSVFIIVVVSVIIFTLIAGTSVYRFPNILPIAENGLQPLITGGFSAFSFPYAEMIVLLLALGGLKAGTSPYKTWMAGLAIGATFLLLASLRNLLILGSENYTMRYYNSYAATKIISLGDFFQRFEILIGINFALAALTKIALCMMSATKGIAKLFNIQEYRKIAAPVGLLMIIFSILVYSNMMQMFDFIKVWKYYAFPFEVILPVIVWIAAEIKSKRVKKTKPLQAQTEAPENAKKAENGPAY